MRRSLSLLVLVSGLAVTAGCGAAADSTEDTATEAARTRAALSEHARGPVALVADAFADVPLEEAQRTEIEQLAREADARHDKIFAAKKEAMLALAEQVEDGAIDRTKLHPKAAAILEALKLSRGDDRAAVQRLHALLDADQREALVDAIEDRFFERLKRRRSEGGPRAIAERLGIDDEQRDRIVDAVRARMQHDQDGPGWLERMRRGKAALQAFEDEDFDVDAAMPAEELDARAVAMEDKILDVAEVVVPLLTPAQREKAASLIREKADADGPF